MEFLALHQRMAARVGVSSAYFVGHIVVLEARNRDCTHEMVQLMWCDMLDVA